MEMRLRRWATWLLAGFGLQFLVGMLLNLFVQLPIPRSSSESDYFSQSAHSLLWALSNGGGLELSVHVYLALALVLGCLGLLVGSIRAAKKSWIWSSVLATIFTVGALFNGLSFVDFNHDLSSMIMAICWLAAVGSLVAGLLIRGPISGTVADK